MKKICSWLFPYKFINWSETIKNHQIEVFYPHDDNEIRNIIEKAKKNNRQLRVVGMGHSISPLVCDKDEKLYLVSLNQYHATPFDIAINEKEMTVEVNAGWQLGRLYDELSKKNLFLPTHPDIPVFTIGGVINNTIHGSRLGSSLMSDDVIALTLIDEKGNKVTIEKGDKDFELYVLSFNLLGIVTSVKFRVERISLEARLVNYYHILEGTRLKREVLDEFFQQIIYRCLQTTSASYNHSFIDCHNGILLSIDWYQGNHSDFVVDDYREIDSVYKIRFLDILLGGLIKNYRQKEKILKLLGKMSRHQIAFGVEKNLQQDRDMFWIDYGVKTIFMSYFIPIHVEGEQINLDKLYAAIEVVTTEIQKSKEEKKHFNLDLPIDIRFVSSSQHAALSPIYQPDKKVIYASIEIINMTNHISLDGDDVMSREFRQFYHHIEQKWIALGGIPHLGKIFGFTGPNNKPFDESFVRSLYSTNVKNILKSKISPLFTNRFMSNLLGL